MSPNELRSALEKHYDLLCFIDMADLCTSHRSIFDLFKKHHREQYLDSQRLVFYTSQDPPQALLDHLQRAGSSVDISNFFIMIVCPFDIRHKIDIANHKYGYDINSPMQSEIHCLDHTVPISLSNIGKPDCLCPLPFFQAEVNAFGEVKPCCKFTGSLGNAATHNLKDIFVNEAFGSVRSQMSDGIKPKACHVCWENEDKGTTSYRQLALHKYGQRLDQEWFDDIAIRELVISPSNLCNFRCRICKPTLSTGVASEELRFTGDAETKNQLRNLIKVTTNDDLSQKILESSEDLAQLNYLHILGGEPFLWPRLDNFTDAFISQGLSKNITLSFNTNCSVFPAEYLNKVMTNFHGIEILLSVDNLGRRFEIERGGHWDEIYQNIQKFIALRSVAVQIKLAVTINIQNVLYLSDIYNFAQQHGLEIVWWYLESPSYLSIDRVNQTVKNLVLEMYQNHADRELQSIAARMTSTPPVDTADFFKYTDTIDLRRNQKFNDTHQEIYQAMLS